jgi:hypothetical protein
MIMEKSSHSVMRVYAGTTDRLGSQLLYEAIVYRAREEGISGATVYRGVMGTDSAAISIPQNSGS